MTQLSPNEILKRSKAAWALRDLWKSILTDAYELVFAGINPYAGASKSPRTMNKQFASTAVTAVVKLASRLLEDMTPPHQNWVEVTSGPVLEMKFGKEEIKQLDDTLAGVSKITNIVVNSGASVDARASAFLDCCIAGMGAVLGMEDPTDDIDPIVDQAVSQSEIAIEEDAKGRLSGIYRKRKIKIREIKGVWDDAIVPEGLMQPDAKDKDPEIEVLEASYKDTGERGAQWRYEVLYCGKGTDPERMVERIYDVCPWTIWRWMKLPGIPYGPSPVLLALADIRTENKVMEMLLKNAALALAGMYMARDDGVLNPDNVLITPGGILTVQSTGGSFGPSIAPLTTNREFNVGEIMLDKLRESIKKQLYDTSLPPETGQPRSATEMIQRIKEFNQDLGIGAGRMQQDTIQYVRRRIEILQKRGLVPPIKIDQYTLKVQINAPLARAQKLSEVQTVVQWYQMAQSVGGPQGAMLVGAFEKILMWMAKQMGVPNDLLRTSMEQEELKQNVAAIVASQAAGAPQAQAA